MALIQYREIERIVCWKFGLTKDEIRGPERKRRSAAPRQILMYLARKHTRRSLPQIGMFLSRDHTTVLHGARKVAAMIETHPKVAAYIAEIEAVLLPAAVINGQEAA